MTLKILTVTNLHTNVAAAARSECLHTRSVSNFAIAPVSQSASVCAAAQHSIGIVSTTTLCAINRYITVESKNYCYQKKEETFLNTDTTLLACSSCTACCFLAAKPRAATVLSSMFL